MEVGTRVQILSATQALLWPGSTTGIIIESNPQHTGAQLGMCYVKLDNPYKLEAKLVEACYYHREDLALIEKL